MWNKTVINYKTIRIFNKTVINYKTIRIFNKLVIVKGTNCWIFQNPEKYIYKLCYHCFKEVYIWEMEKKIFLKFKIFLLAAILDYVIFFCNFGNVFSQKLANIFSKFFHIQNQHHLINKLMLFSVCWNIFLIFKKKVITGLCANSRKFRDFWTKWYITKKPRLAKYSK